MIYYLLDLALRFLSGFLATSILSPQKKFFLSTGVLVIFVLIGGTFLKGLEVAVFGSVNIEKPSFEVGVLGIFFGSIIGEVLRRYREDRRNSNNSKEIDPIQIEA